MDILTIQRSLFLRFKHVSHDIALTSVVSKITLASITPLSDYFNIICTLEPKSALLTAWRMVRDRAGNSSPHAIHNNSSSH